MGRWSTDGVRIATHIFEAAAWHYALKPVCRCSHGAAFNPHGLWWYFERRHWDDALAKARHRFWCRICAGRFGRRIRPLRIDLVGESDDDIRLPFPPDHEWKRAVRRFRC